MYPYFCDRDESFKLFAGDRGTWKTRSGETKAGEIVQILKGEPNQLPSANLEDQIYLAKKAATIVAVPWLLPHDDSAEFFSEALYSSNIYFRAARDRYLIWVPNPEKKKGRFFTPLKKIAEETWDHEEF